MGLYIERESSPIALEEWLEYVSKDNELTLSEVGIAINPLTKTKMSFQIAGRAIWNDFYEFTFDNGRIRGEGEDINILMQKLFEIAPALSAFVFDCGERCY